jgi:hypothetical protein
MELYLKNLSNRYKLAKKHQKSEIIAENKKITVTMIQWDIALRANRAGRYLTS